MKKGYTLAEALVAMGIVGLIAAIMVPMMNKFKPDTAKVVYLKNYDSIVEAIDYFANSKTLYPVYNENESREKYKYLMYQGYPLYNTLAISDNETGIKLSSGEQKFCEILALSFGVEPSNTSCNITDFAGSTPSFTTKSGADYIVKTTIKEPVSNKGYFKAEILLDIDGLDKGKNSEYNAANCKYPDRFRFVVYSAGQLYAMDKKGQSYLTKRSSFRKIEDNVDELAYGTKDYTQFPLIFQNPEVEGNKESGGKPEEEESTEKDFYSIENPTFWFADAGTSGMTVYATSTNSLQDFLDLYSDYKVQQVSGPSPQKYWVGGYYNEFANGTASSFDDLKDAMDRTYDDTTNYKWYKVENDPFYDSSLASHPNYQVYRVWTGSEMRVVHCYDW